MFLGLERRVSLDPSGMYLSSRSDLESFKYCLKAKLSDYTTGTELGSMEYDLIVFAVREATS